MARARTTSCFMRLDIVFLPKRAPNSALSPASDSGSLERLQGQADQSDDSHHDRDPHHGVGWHALKPGGERFAAPFVRPEGARGGGDRRISEKFAAQTRDVVT